MAGAPMANSKHMDATDGASELPNPVELPKVNMFIFQLLSVGSRLEEKKTTKKTLVYRLMPRKDALILCSTHHE